MENYISKDYFPRLEELMVSAKEDILSGKASNLNILFQLLSALPLNIDLKNTDVVKYARSLLGNKAYDSFKDRIIMNALKNQKLKTCDFIDIKTDIKNPSAFYFLSDASVEAVDQSIGVVCKGLDYDGEEFYESCTVADLPISNDWKPISNSVPPANAMLLIDKYIFGSPVENKLKSLLEFIKLYKGSLKIPFHLSILFSNEHGNQNICTKYQINNAFDELRKINNLEVRLYLDNNIPHHDRLIFTNYTTGNIGIPFAGFNTRFSQNFLGRSTSAEGVLRNYKHYKKDLISWNSFLLKIPNRMGNIQTIWETSNFENRLFVPICNTD